LQSGPYSRIFFLIWPLDQFQFLIVFYLKKLEGDRLMA
jgi:hypothetical protein